jgi:thiamine-phosphate pyrophosphorylase
MSFDLSPAVERIVAEFHGREPMLHDWWVALLADEDGKPHSLLTRLRVDISELLSLTEIHSRTAMKTTELLEIAREKSLFSRSDANITTDTVLLALVESDVSVAKFDWPARLLQLLTPAPVAGTTDEASPEFVVAEPQESLELARIVDVNLNRARESLRILDDYARFVRNDQLLTAEIKQLRHDLVAASTILPDRLLLAARDTLGDVGTSLTTSTEGTRDSANHVAVVNVKRLQEALRSLEEYGKALNQMFAASIESVRYRAYTIERAILVGLAASERLADAHVYALLTKSQCVAGVDWMIAEMAAGGVSIIQMREKHRTDSELLHLAQDYRKWCSKAGVLFIVNDRPDIAAIVGADGVHLGQDDLPVAAARRIVGSQALIGVSTHNLGQVRQAMLDGADYIGVGPCFPSKTKTFDDFPGLNFVREVAASTTLPAFALGGITLENASSVRAAGLNRVAVSSLLAQADEPQPVASQLRYLMMS